MRWALACLVLVAACLDPGLVPCGDRLCPRGAVCLAGDVCATQDQVAACEGIADGMPCMNHGIGVCDHGACVPTGCGNGTIDPGEACDDSNATGGDGCSADCRKVELCGDGVVDELEGCDDGNANAADGCDLCTPTTWTSTAIIGSAVAATSTGISLPYAVATDRAGNVYIAETGGNRITRVDTAGSITTIAGTGVRGSSADNILATSANFDGPLGVAADGLGNVFISDTANHKVRRVDPSGIITTFAGTNAGSLGDNGPATAAQLTRPGGLAVDGLGNLYIADTANHRVRRVGTNGVITTVAGTGTAGFGGDNGNALGAMLSSPSAIALDVDDNLYIVDGGNNRVRRVDAVTHTIVTVAGGGAGGDGGLAASAALNGPKGIALTPDGSFFIAEANTYRIRRVDGTTATISTIAGTTSGFAGDGGPATAAKFFSPAGLALDHAGTLFIADANNNRIRAIDTQGTIATIAGDGSTGSVGDGGAATSARLDRPLGVAIDGATGAIYIADANNFRIRRVDADGVIATVAGNGANGFGGDGGPAVDAQLGPPYGVALDGQGGFYIVDTNNTRIRHVDAGGTITTVAGGVFVNAVVADGAGGFYVADGAGLRVQRVDAAGMITTVAGNGTVGSGGDGGPATSAQVVPNALAVDGAGNLYIADAVNHRVRRVSAGTITTVAGTGTAGSGGDGGLATNAQLSGGAIALDAAGNLYLAEGDTFRVRRVDATTKIITTIVGTGAEGDDGDGGPATSAQLSRPTAIASDAAGNLVIATDPSTFGGQRIRYVSTSGTITAVAGRIDPAGMGPVADARLADPRAIVRTPVFTLVAGGSSGTIQAIDATGSRVAVVAGRYPQFAPTAMLARYRTRFFGAVGGVAYDAAAGIVYVAESSVNRLHAITIVDPADATTWTIESLANPTGAAGFADGSGAAARFRNPTALYLDATVHTLYVADTDNHVVRAIDLAAGVAGATVHTVIGTPVTRGFFGDGGDAAAALLFTPRAITKCANGDLFVADTGNNRIRRVAAGTNTITTVLGDGVAASSGEGRPATAFPIDAPTGLACDPAGNLAATSTTTVRFLAADDAGMIDGTRSVQTIYGAGDTFPANVTTCLTGIAIVDAATLHVADACTGLLVELHRVPIAP